MDIKAPIAFGCLLLFICISNALCIFVLVKTKKLRQSRFHALILSLSISDLCNGLSLGFRIFFYFVHVPYACLVCEWMMYFSTLLSLFNTFLVCLERLNCTFPVQKRWIRKLTSNWTIMCSVIIFLITGSLSVPVQVLYAQSTNMSKSCIFIELATPFIVDLPLIIMVTAITVVYGAVIKRMHDRVQKVHPISSSLCGRRYSSQSNENTKSTCVRSSIRSNDQRNTHSTENPCLFESSEITKCSESDPNTALSMNKSVSEQSRLGHTKSTCKGQSKIKEKDELGGVEVQSCVLRGVEKQPGQATIKQKEESSVRKKRFRNNVITLGAIIVITYVAVLPKCVLSGLMLAEPGLMNESKLHLIKGCFLVNALFDPYIYILRIKEFREKLKLWK